MKHIKIFEEFSAKDDYDRIDTSKLSDPTTLSEVEELFQDIADTWNLTKVDKISFSNSSNSADGYYSLYYNSGESYTPGSPNQHFIINIVLPIKIDRVGYAKFKSDINSFKKRMKNIGIPCDNWQYYRDSKSSKTPSYRARIFF